MTYKMVNNKKQKLFRWLKIVIFLYCSIGIALYYLQDYFLFHPTPLPRNYSFHFNKPFEEINIPFNKTDTINLVKFLPKNDLATKGIVLYFHGNKGNIERYAKFADNFTQHGYQVWMPDYPTFGKSIGDCSEKALYNYALQIQKLAATKISADSIIIYGKSFGTGIAAYLAANTKCKKLILETPYYSIVNLFNSYAPIYPNSRMANYKIPTYQYLLNVKYPITIFHGTQDGVIFYRTAVKLKEVLKPTDEFITIQNGTHHNLNDFPLYHQKLDSLLQ